MNLRVLAIQKPASSPSSVPTEPAHKTEAARGHTRRRRHTPHNHQDRLIRIITRILLTIGFLMMIWLLLEALGWI